MKTLLSLVVLSTLAFTAQAAPKLPAKKKSTSVPTALPAYKGKTKVAVEFQASQETAVVLVAEPIANDKAQVKELKEETKVVAKPTPAPAVDVAVVEPTPTPSPTPIAIATPAPEPKDDIKKMDPFVIETTKPIANAVPSAAEKPAPVVVATPAPSSVIEKTATVSAMTTSIETTSLSSPQKRRSVFFDAGTIDSHYDKLKSDLKNGASTMSISLGIEIEKKMEVHAALDVAHGYDQAVTPQNTRLLAARAGVTTIIGRVGRLDVSAGGTIGAAGIDVRSYRGVSAAGFTLEQHAMGTAMVVAPELEARTEIGNQVLVRLALRYWRFVGADDLVQLSALAASAGVGYEF